MREQQKECCFDAWKCVSDFLTDECGALSRNAKAILAVLFVVALLIMAALAMREGAIWIVDYLESLIRDGCFTPQERLVS